jgi:hypothetical protein
MALCTGGFLSCLPDMPAPAAARRQPGSQVDPESPNSCIVTHRNSATARVTACGAGTSRHCRELPPRMPPVRPPAPLTVLEMPDSDSAAVKNANPGQVLPDMPGRRSRYSRLCLDGCTARSIEVVLQRID